MSAADGAAGSGADCPGEWGVRSTVLLIGTGDAGMQAPVSVCQLTEGLARPDDAGWTAGPQLCGQYVDRPPRRLPVLRTDGGGATPLRSIHHTGRPAAAVSAGPGTGRISARRPPPAGFRVRGGLGWGGDYFAPTPA